MGGVIQKVEEPAIQGSVNLANLHFIPQSWFEGKQLQAFLSNISEWAINSKAEKIAFQPRISGESAGFADEEKGFFKIRFHYEDGSSPIEFVATKEGLMLPSKNGAEPELAYSWKEFDKESFLADPRK